MEKIFSISGNLSGFDAKKTWTFCLRGSGGTGGHERQTQKTRWCLQGWYGSVLIEKWRSLPIWGLP